MGKHKSYRFRTDQKKEAVPKVQVKMVTQVWNPHWSQPSHPSEGYLSFQPHAAEMIQPYKLIISKKLSHGQEEREKK